jgi:hypothetical protein
MYLLYGDPTPRHVSHVMAEWLHSWMALGAQHGCHDPPRAQACKNRERLFAHAHCE